MIWLADTFMPGGSIGRGRFLVGHVVGAVVVMLLTFVIGLLAMSFPGSGVRTVLVAATVGMFSLGMVVMSSLLVANRLSDRGDPSWHAAWYGGMLILAFVMPRSSIHLMSLGGAAVSACVAVWVLLAVSKGRRRG